MPVIQEFVLILPEIILLITALGTLLWGAFANNHKHIDYVILVTLGALFAAFAYTFTDDQPSQSALYEQLVFNDCTRFFKRVILMATAAVLLMGYRYYKQENLRRAEYSVLMILATVGMMVMVSANDLMAFIIGLELQSLSLYIMVAFHRDNLLSSEAALKYFILSSIATAFVLYGCSFIFGYTGSTKFTVITALLKATTIWPIGLKSGVLLVLIGAGFKISLAPFHMWTPDVYQGSPTPTTAFIGAVSKVAGIAIFIRLLMDVFTPLFVTYIPFIMGLAIVSMLVGSFAALRQNNIKRLLGYSTVSHMGYAMVGLISGSFIGLQSTIMYISLYAIMTITAFACILCLHRQGKSIDEIDKLSGLADDKPFIAAALAITLFSLAGIPPLAGFFAKLAVFSAAIQQGYYLLAVVGLLTSVVSAAYYLKIIKIMYFDKPQVDQMGLAMDTPVPRPTLFVIVVGVVLTIGYVAKSSWLVDGSYKATKAIYQEL